MQNHHERRAGAERRGADRSAIGNEWRWYEGLFGTSAGGEYNPDDPYWEAEKGQDDD